MTATEAARDRLAVGHRVRARDGTRTGKVVGFGLHPGAVVVSVDGGSPWVLSWADLWERVYPAYPVARAARGESPWHPGDAAGPEE